MTSFHVQEENLLVVDKKVVYWKNLLLVFIGEITWSSLIAHVVDLLLLERTLTIWMITSTKISSKTLSLNLHEQNVIVVEVWPFALSKTQSIVLKFYFMPR